MLFRNKLGALAPLDFHHLRKVKQEGLEFVTLELTHTDYTPQEISELLQLQQLEVIAVRLPETFQLGYQEVDTTAFSQLLDLVSSAFPQQEINLILVGKAVALGEIFDYFETKPGDFKALQDFKELWKQSMIDSIRKIKDLAEAKGISLLLENAPIGGLHYFEPGHERIYPILRTPHFLLEVVKEAGIGICFHTGNARVVCNVLQYMKRSRSIFAAATEDEILRSPVDWLDFYTQISPYTKLIHLTDSLSWGDTQATNNIPFRSEHIHELLKFSDMMQEEQTPIVLHVKHEQWGKPEDNYINQMLKVLRELKKG
jgi:hypothetical protein